jgi:hypothetical protein
MNVNMMGIWRLPGNSMPIGDSHKLKNIKYFNTKSRSQWDYQGIDEKITNQSQFKDLSQREDFNGPRKDHQVTYHYSLDSNGHGYTRLHEYFDEYTQPGIDKKAAIARSVKEHWDADEFYYPGETWRRNRPSFRSVPQELLNKQTWYHWIDLAYNLNELAVTYRNRMWNPQWPPPGHKMPKFNTTREFVFGVDDPALVAEIERWYWFRNWFENNMKQGPWEWLGYFMFGVWFWATVRSQHCNTKYKAMLANMYYPGRQAFRSFGEPKDWATERWWWQEPLETWPNQGEVWFCGEMRWKYINMKKKEDAETKLRDELVGLGTAQTGLTGEQFYNNRDSGNRGHWYWWGRYGGFGLQSGGTNLPRKEIGSNSGLFHFQKKDYEGKDRFQYEEDAPGTGLNNKFDKIDWRARDPHHIKEESKITEPEWRVGKTLL